MKTKIFLLILIFGTGYLAWDLFVNNFSQEPIEIIANPSFNNPTSEKIASSEVIESTEDAPKEIEIENPPISEEKIENPPINQEKKETSPTDEKEEASSENKDASFIINKKTTWGYSTSNNRNIDTLIIHSSYDALGTEPYDLEGLINEYKQYGVAPHFLINRKGNVYRLVDEKNIAYHAGISKMPDGRTGANNFSIGIELMNTKEDDYTKNQYSALNKLIDYLEKQYDIKYVLGHQDISPDRKTDPWNFDWKKINSKNAIH